MPKRVDIKKILIIGSGPIVIGQGAEFDYSGTQACIAIKELGFETVLVNSNPATIMTDKNIADKIYMDPINIKYLKKIILKERPCALLGSIGGQTSLNLTLELEKSGILKETGCKIIGTSAKAIESSENRDKFIKVCKKINEKCIDSIIAKDEKEIFEAVNILKYPIILRPAFTLGGTGGGVAYDENQLTKMAKIAINASPICEVLVEKYVVGYKEIEYEVIRDSNDNVITVCNMENIEPVGVHTGDSIVVCPSQTLCNKEYQSMRNSAIKIIKELKIEGGCNVQFAFNPQTLEHYVIEINPRVSRSSALASKASGYPIAKVTAMIACGFNLDEIKLSNTSAAYEPSLDYVVTKIPRFPFDKFPLISKELSTQMKSTGEVMAIGRNFEESFLKAIRSLEIKASHLWLKKFDNYSVEDLFENIKTFTNETVFAIAQILRHGDFVKKISFITKIDSFFINKIKNIIDLELEIKKIKLLNPQILKKAKEMGFSDKYIACICNKSLFEIIKIRKEYNIIPSYKMIDSCASEFNSYIPYFYSTYIAEENESISNNSKKIIVLGSGPIRIGQGIEFDYSTVHAIIALKNLGFEVIVINNNPSTVSTDYSISDKLYFEPLTEEDILNIVDLENPIGVILTLGGQTSINLAQSLEDLGINIIGTGTEAIRLAEDRKKFEAFLNKINISQPDGECVSDLESGKKVALKLGFPVLVRPSFVLGGRAMKIIYNEFELSSYIEDALAEADDSSILIDKYILGKEVEVDAVSDTIDVFVPGIIEHVEKTGVHSGDSISVYPTFSLDETIKNVIISYTKKIGVSLGINGPFNIQYVIDENNKVYVIEVNPRSSRTVPFLSKSCGINIAKIAVKVQAGISLKSQGVFDKTLKKNNFCVKVPVFSFEKIHGVDTYLSPEMKSTGEAIGIDKKLENAFYKALIAAGYKIKEKGIVLVTVADINKKQVIPIVRRIINLGFKVYSTKGTFEFLEQNFIKTKFIKKPSEGVDEILELISKKIFAFIINTQSVNEINNKDGFLIRRKAVESNVNIFTSLDTINMLLNVLEIKYLKLHGDKT